MKKRKNTHGRTDGVVIPFPTKLRPLAERMVDESSLYATLAAGKARRALDGLQDEEALPSSKRRGLIRFLVTYFQKKGVRFDEDGRPLLPLGLCGDVDAEKMLEATSMIAIEFFDALADKFGDDLLLEGELGILYDLGWRHGFFYSHDAEEPDRWLVPVVLTLDMKDMRFILESRGARRTEPKGAMTSVEALVASQKPNVWDRWLSLRGRAV